MASPFNVSYCTAQEYFLVLTLHFGELTAWLVSHHWPHIALWVMFRQSFGKISTSEFLITFLFPHFFLRRSYSVTWYISLGDLPSPAQHALACDAVPHHILISTLEKYEEDYPVDKELVKLSYSGLWSMALCPREVQQSVVSPVLGPVLLNILISDFNSRNQCALSRFSYDPKLMLHGGWKYREFS